MARSRAKKPGRTVLEKRKAKREKQAAQAQIRRKRDSLSPVAS